MVVMEGVCAASSSGSGGVGGSDPITSHAAAQAHRSWYDQAAASLTQAGAEAGGGGSAAGSQSEIDAYFKAGSAANATSYFSQMQGAYSGMSSYHGESLGMDVDIQDSEAIAAATMLLSKSLKKIVKIKVVIAH